MIVRWRKDLANERSSEDRKSTRLNSSHLVISYAVFCLKKKKTYTHVSLGVVAIHDHVVHRAQLRQLRGLAPLAERQSDCAQYPFFNVRLCWQDLDQPVT